MQFKVTAGEFHRALASAVVNIEAKPTTKFFSGALVTVTKDGVTVTGAGLGGTVFSQETVTGAEVETNGKAIIEHRPLLNYVSLLDSETELSVSLNEKSTSLVVKAADSQPYAFSVLHGAADFPKAPAPKDHEHSLTLSEIRSVMPHAARIAATIPNKQQPRVKLVSKSESLILDATDTFRLLRVEWKNHGFEDFSWTFPKDEFERALAGDPVLVTWDQKISKFTTPTGFTTFKRLPEELEIPDFTALLERPHSAKVLVDAVEFSSKVHRLTAVSPKANLRITLDHETLSLTLTQSITSGSSVSGEENIAVLDGPTESIEVSVSVKYLQDALAAHKADGMVTLELTSGSDPIRLRSHNGAPDGDEGELVKTSIIMPVRA